MKIFSSGPIFKNALRLLALVLMLSATVASQVDAGAARLSGRASHPYDSCDVEQSDGTSLNSVFQVTVRNNPPAPISLTAPSSWACEVVDGHGSGASAQIFPPEGATASDGARNGISVSISAGVQDGIGTGICPYSTYRHWNVTFPCDAANSRRPHGTSVKYLFGNAGSSRVIVEVVSPANVAPPAYTPGPGGVPTLSVLVAQASHNFDMWMTCRMGVALNATCRADALAFARAVQREPGF
ncbi:MAG TPA: hypothetical protein VGG21_09445 [Acidimicrobiales bacterium]